MKIAVIDIGTNSFILLIAEIKNKEFKVLNQYFEIPRLGANLTVDNTIDQESINYAIQSLHNFKKIIDEHKIDVVIPVATAVLREAKNNLQVKELLSKVIGVDIEVISGKQEAEFSFMGAVSTNDECIIIDVGGGSTEIIFGYDQQIQFSESFPIGAAKLKSKFFHTQINSGSIEKSIKYIKSMLNIDFEFPKNSKLIGVGGTITTLAHIISGLNAYDSCLINNTIISYQRNKTLFEELFKLESMQISNKYNIHPKRADILTSGQLIYLVLQELFNFADIKVSTQGLRFGILKKYIQENS